MTEKTIEDENKVLKHSIARLRDRLAEQTALLERHVLEKRQLIEGNADLLEKLSVLGDAIRTTIRLTDDFCYIPDDVPGKVDADHTVDGIVAATECRAVREILGIDDTSPRYDAAMLRAEEMRRAAREKSDETV